MEKMYGAADHVRMNGLDFKSKMQKIVFKTTIYTFDDVPGNYFDRRVISAHIESDMYLFVGIK